MNDQELAHTLRELADDPALLTAVHVAIEDELIELRDAGISIMGPANGLVVRYKDGTHSDAIRIGTRQAVEMALAAAADHVEKRQQQP